MERETIITNEITRYTWKYSQAELFQPVFLVHVAIDGWAHKYFILREGTWLRAEETRPRQLSQMQTERAPLF